MSASWDRKQSISFMFQIPRSGRRLEMEGGIGIQDVLSDSESKDSPRLALDQEVAELLQLTDDLEHQLGALHHAQRQLSFMLSDMKRLLG
jgi:hypothetical protein